MPVLPERRSLAGAMAIAAVAVAYAAPISGLGWNQGAHYALVEALDRGTARIDPWRWQTGDVAYFDGHFYAAKAPGLAATSVPAYAALEATGATGLIDRHTSTHWKAARVTIWALGLWSVVLPAVGLLLLVRTLADRLEPGFGTATAITLGLGTLVLPFSTLFFAHILASLLAFAAFAVLWNERHRGSHLGPVAAAGLLAALAVSVDYTTAIIVPALGLYAVVRRSGPARRGLAYVGGAVVGGAVLMLYNWWAFGSVRHFPYQDVVSKLGRTGHAVIGENASGLFGVGVPSLRVAAELLFASRGLLIVTPVVVMGVVGIGLLYRRGWHAEALVISFIASALFVLNTGYFLPFGGWAAGPRFLVPALPFVALPLAFAYRWYPGRTIALAAASVVLMVGATAAGPLLPNGDTSVWATSIAAGRFQETVASLAGAGHGWLGVLPFVVPILAAIAFAILATPFPEVRAAEVRRAVLLLLAWTLVACVLPQLWRGPGDGMIVLIVAAAGVGILALTAAALATQPEPVGVRAA